MAFSREGCLGIRSKVVTVNIPDYGDFNLRIITLAETKAWQKKNAADSSKILDTLLAYTLADDEGKRLFKDDEAELIATSMEFPLVEALADQALRINKLRKEDKTPQATAEQAKN